MEIKAIKFRKDGSIPNPSPLAERKAQTNSTGTSAIAAVCKTT